MDEQLSFIETQFPVSKISKESYKERKANNGQTLTGLGKWWGRKPLILVRAAIIGALLPAGKDPQKDTQIFLKIMSMDKEGLEERKTKKISPKVLYKRISENRELYLKYGKYFINDGKKVIIDTNSPRNDIERDVFNSFGYDEKLSYCERPEKLQNIKADSWYEVNEYLGTHASSLLELVQELSIMKYGHNVVVGDCFCGGGSIPFEASRIGCDVRASDLNPIAGLLTWSDINICGSNDKEYSEILKFQTRVLKTVKKKIRDLGIEINEKGEQAVAYLYCIETKCPECGKMIPLLPSLVIGKGTKTIVDLVDCGGGYDFKVSMNVSSDAMEKAERGGTISASELICPCCGKRTPIGSIRHDRITPDGTTIYGLRAWEKKDIVPRSTDIYHTRLYAIKYQDDHGKRYYREPNDRDIENENRIIEIVKSNFEKWSKEGTIPSMKIEDGYNTSQLFRERGWHYWHQLFNCRQLLILHLFMEEILKEENKLNRVTGLLGLNRLADWNSKRSTFCTGVGIEKVIHSFYNQALNTMYNYGALASLSFDSCWNYSINRAKVNKNGARISLGDAASIDYNCDLWITDPPYADAVNYHELASFFLSWDKEVIAQTFPHWYTDSKQILAVKGDENFSDTMIKIYSNLVHHMPDNGMQIVMFTHSDPAVWAQLAIIMWRAGLRVTAAWNIATETDASGLKNGNYVKGTVLLVLRKQTGSDVAFLDEINADIREEVKRQISSMQQLDDKEEQNFSDPDYVLAAYAASLKVLTSYKEIEDLDLDYELNKAISDPSNSKVVAIIENAKKIAYDCVIPTDFDNYFWRELTNAEKFYIKGLESEKHGNYQIGTYQEFARGFSIGGYSQLMESERANSARLKTPYEMGDRSLNDVPDFQNSLMRTVFEGIYVAIKNDMNPSKGLDFIKNDIPNYWDKREMIQQILSFLVDINDISNMQEHWADSAKMADALLTVVKHDSI
ncbi:anti-phage-associated DUF1156 domain-containing protein [Bacillota bacterium HCP3S3_E9]